MIRLKTKLYKQLGILSLLLIIILREIECLVVEDNPTTTLFPSRPPQLLSALMPSLEVEPLKSRKGMSTDPPSLVPSPSPSSNLSFAPSLILSRNPSEIPSAEIRNETPTTSPSLEPSPSLSPSSTPSFIPSLILSRNPSQTPSYDESQISTASYSTKPSLTKKSTPTPFPSLQSSLPPSFEPTAPPRTPTISYSTKSPTYYFHPTEILSYRSTRTPTKAYSTKKPALRPSTTWGQSPKKKVDVVQLSFQDEEEGTFSVLWAIPIAAAGCVGLIICLSLICRSKRKIDQKRRRHEDHDREKSQYKRRKVFRRRGRDDRQHHNPRVKGRNGRQSHKHREMSCYDRQDYNRREKGRDDRQHRDHREMGCDDQQDYDCRNMNRDDRQNHNHRDMYRDDRPRKEQTRKSRRGGFASTVKRIKKDISKYLFEDPSINEDYYRSQKKRSGRYQHRRRDDRDDCDDWQHDDYDSDHY